jgi:hypothetical protein
MNPKENEAKKHPLFIEYQKLRAQLEVLYSNHRKKALKIFRNSPDVLSELQLNGVIPTFYSEWCTVVERFYNQLHANGILKERLLKFHFPIVELKKGKQTYEQMQLARCNYLKNKQKDTFANIEDNELIVSLEQWMDDFLIAAELALENKPRLLKALGIKQTLY